MRLTSQHLEYDTTQPVKIQIVSRQIPVENTCGSGTYLLDLMCYLRQMGFEIELICVAPSPGGKMPWYIVPSVVEELVNISVRYDLRLGSILFRFKALSEWVTAPLQLVYNQLPAPLKNIYRSARKRLRQMGNQVAKSANSQLQAWHAWATPEEIAFARDRFTKFKPDVVIANYAWLGGVLDVIPPNEAVLKVMLTHDIHYQRFAALKKAGIALDGLDWDWEKESVQCRKAQVLLAIQKEDARVLKEMAPLSEVICMPMSAVCHSYATKQVPGRCLFVGSSESHNIHGLQWFLDHVWPIVLQSVPHCSLHVCGTVYKEIQGKFANVHFLGKVDDLKPEYGAAEVCLVPLLIGSGLKIKLVEALSYGRACVSTSIGVQGIGEIVDKAVIVANTAEDFAAAVYMLLTNPDKRRWMEEQARKYVIEQLSPQAVYQPFVERIYQHLRQAERHCQVNTNTDFSRKIKNEGEHPTFAEISNGE